MPQTAYCSVILAPLRVTPDHRSEQYSQLLLNDAVVVGQTEGAWIFVRALWNGDEGWVLKGQLQWNDASLPVIFGMNNLVRNKVCGIFQVEENGSNFLMGSSWIERNRTGANNLGVEPIAVAPASDALLDSTLADVLSKLADVFMGAPYVWGGMSVWGIDCSGLVQMLYRYRGIPLPHSASKQAEMGRVLDFIQEVRPGDLAFFNNEEGAIVHVGIMLSPDRLLHASARSGRVQVDAIDWQGIVAADGQRTHALRIITRLEE